MVFLMGALIIAGPTGLMAGYLFRLIVWMARGMFEESWRAATIIWGITLLAVVLRFGHAFVTETQRVLATPGSLRFLTIFFISGILGFHLGSRWIRKYIELGQ